MNGAELLVKSLEAEGVTHIFGVPGEENLAFLEALSHSSIKLVVTRHEQSAGFMAATFGRLTGKPGVCLSTLGPGATNLVTAAAYANLGGMPLLMITGQKPIKKSKQGNFQIVDVVEMMRPVTKWSRQIIFADKIPAMVRHAFRVAVEERPGAVLLELPEDVAAEQAVAVPFEIVALRRPIAEEKAIAAAAEIIASARRPLIAIGGGANRKQVSKMLTEFVAKTKIPFFNTQMGKGVIDERSEQFLGTAALSQNDYLHCAIEAADVIINVGHDSIEKPPFIMKRNGQTVIALNFFSADINDIYFPQCEVVGDIANAIWQLKERLAPSPQWDFSYFYQIKALLEDHIRLKQDQVRFPLTPQQIVSDTREALSEDDLLALDNGMYKLWFARNFKAYRPNSLLLDNALATMGAGVPSAIAAKLLYPDRNVVALVGDGGFLMNSQDLETAVRLKLDLTIVILNDNGYGMIKWKQQSEGLTDFGLSYGNPDFVKYAESYGATGYRVGSAEAYKALLERSKTERGVTIIEVPLDYSENVKVFTEELKNKTCPTFNPT